MKDQTITFAAICQVAYQVQQVSRTGQISDEEFSVLLQSIIETSPVNTLAVYGGEIGNIKKGLELLISHLGSDNGTDSAKKGKDPELTRYIISLINLERRLTKQPKQLNALGERINATERQLEHYTLTSDTLTASFASIYSDIISPLGHKIQVTGEPSILKQNINQYKIRALLLAGIRAAVLWRQVGGKRRHILFSRKKIVDTAKELLKSIR
ncbi:high frequency lysogenization protein HflD [Colwellia demingiae]|uniref:High frequency lysogenization protein HflD homolog n=1 Tax=Colwellia demingiae TaxID=89401 RepID=A0A5C6QA98_9GAMM|nr:high frequency lysogenization protein HflD [Colwellia demingiae]TWX65964.1 high frequency lysogenization protein HflD [Colwellia demingiae]